MFPCLGQIVHSYGTGADGYSSSPSPSETFSYDNSGNLVVKDNKTIDHNGWQLSRMRNQDGSLCCSFQYSADGNLTAKLDSSGNLISAMEYDADGRLSKVDGTSFVYDFKGRLIKSVRSNGLVTWYPSHSYEVSTALNGITRTAYITQGDRRLASLTEVGPRASTGPDRRPLARPLSASSVHYFHHDHLGSVVASSSEFGEIRATYAYDPFGKVVVEGDDISRYKYSGKEQFGGLYYFGARFYDSQVSYELNFILLNIYSSRDLQTGRFLTLDNYPVSLTKISPSMFNQYAFARNDPINFVDVNGNVPWWHWYDVLVLYCSGDIFGLKA
jgi:YD repeat-containing protein